MILDEILRRKRLDLKRIRDERKLVEVKAEARSAPPLRDFPGALRRNGEVAIIAEVKRASPTGGDLRSDLDPAVWAARYEEGGAAAISVLTDAPFFQGTPRDLRSARAAVTLPVLRKDFIVDEYQLWESRTFPADAVLLIVRALEQGQLVDYLALTREELGVPALVEVHSEGEAERALDAGARIVGINNRDLESFHVSLETTVRIRPMIPDGVTLVSESGITGPADIALLRSLGIDAALVGEELVKADDPAGRLRELRGAG